MSKKEKYIDPTPDFEKQTDAFFRNTKIPFSKSKEEVWHVLGSKLRTTQSKKINLISQYRVVFSIAASVLLLAGILSIFRFYTTTVACPAGQHLTVNLPDGSTVELNALSTLHYQPLWWPVSRKLQLEGEGYFEVEKGKKFVVRSMSGRTEVLGTSFNIFARKGIYNVSCHTGKVKVASPQKDEAILSPGYQASINPDGKVVVFKTEKPENTISWVDDKFIFTGTPFTAVIYEIERQYNVQIKIPAGLNYYYTGYFTKDIPVEQVLELVCKPFGLTFVAKQEGRYELEIN